MSATPDQGFLIEPGTAESLHEDAPSVIGISKSPYEDVPLAKGFIRVLQLLDSDYNGCTSDPLRCRLHLIPLPESTVPSTPQTKSYVALSYVWGTSEATESIELNGRPFKIRPNLKDFLVQYREHRRSGALLDKDLSFGYSPDMFLWVDALCINQDDIAERNEQVPHIGEIFKSAHGVLNWLGVLQTTPRVRHDDLMKAQTLFRSIKVKRSPDFGDSPRFWQICEAYRAALLLHKFGPHLDVCELLLKNKYWHRLWVVPECYNAAQRALLWDNAIFCWRALNSFRNAVVAFEGLNSRFWRSLRKLLSLHDHERIQRVATTTGSAFTAFWNSNDLARHANPRVKRYFSSTDLEFLFCGTADSLCREPHDRVYALVGLSERAVRQITPDYAQSSEQLFAQVLLYMQETMKDTQLLLEEWSLPKKDKLESSADDKIWCFRAIAALIKGLQIDEDAIVALPPDGAKVALRSVEPLASYLSLPECELQLHRREPPGLS